jgi:RNA polymerase sigma factor (sigma-70 family)
MQNLPDREKGILHPQGDPGAEDLRSLMEEIREGSPRAFQELVDRLWPELVRFAVWDNGDPDAARDAVQEAFIDFWRRRDSWVQAGSPRAYLYRAVRHQLLDEQRRKKVRESWAARERLRLPPRPADPGEVLAATRAEEAFAEAVASLPPRRREAFSLVVLRGLSHREAAEVLDVSEQTVANQVSTALREVREILTSVTGQDL